MFTRLGWRWLLALSSTPLLALTVLYPVLPESPFFLAATGRTGAAAAVLQRVARANGRPLPPGALQAHPPPAVRCPRWLSPSSSLPAHCGCRAEAHPPPMACVPWCSALHGDPPQEHRAEARMRCMSAVLAMFVSDGKACAAMPVSAAQAGKAGRSEPGAPANGGAPERPGAALAAWRRVAAPVARLLSPALRRTSLLLLVIWFTNALNYYGLVLLTTTVRPAT